MPNPSYDFASLWLFAAALVGPVVLCVCVTALDSPRMRARGVLLSRWVEPRFMAAGDAVAAGVMACVRACMRVRVWVCSVVYLPIALACRWSESVYLAVARSRAEKECYTGVCQYDEWVAEIEALPLGPTRRMLQAEVMRYMPSERLRKRAWSLRGRNCLEVRAEERERLRRCAA